ncbi:Cytochrome P450 3A25 [Halotydeus destructor]|nr:Cytochrome P450 3A25 [Halotydeus destructor]
MDIVIYILAIIIVFTSYVRFKLTFWKRQGIPNDVASIWNRFTEPFHIADQRAIRKHGDIIGTYEGLRPTLTITDPVLIKKVLIEEFHNFPNHRRFYHEDQIAGKNIVVLENEKWRQLRSQLTPVFTSAKLRSMSPIFDECIDTLLSNLERKTKQGSTTLNLKSYVGCFSLDVIASTAFGTKLDSMNDPENIMAQNMKNFFGKNLSLKSIIVLFFPSLMKYFDIYLFDYNVLVFLSNLAHHIIKDRIKQGEDGITPRRDVIQLLLEAEGDDGKKLTREEIADNLMLFLVAGFDTTSTAMCAVLYCLARNRGCQDKLRAEIRENLAQTGKLRNHEEIGKSKYLDAVIKESLRLLPSVPRIERRSNKECFLGTMFIPNDTVVIIPIYTLCHDLRYFA